MEARALSKEPPVINFGPGPVQLTSSKFLFDIDSNGQLVGIPSLGQNSGFLALDKNGNGKIDNGTELFGPATGNGFEELRKYDSDGNGWIDEKDPAYNQLRIWQKDA